MLEKLTFDVEKVFNTWKLKRIVYLEIGNKCHLVNEIEDDQPAYHQIFGFCVGKVLKEAVSTGAISFRYCWRVNEIEEFNKIKRKIKRNEYPRLNEKYNEINRRMNEGKTHNGEQLTISAENIDW